MTLTLDRPRSVPRPSIIHPRTGRSIERKTLAFDQAAIDANGTLTGYGAIFGNVDDGGDIIERGFFADVIPGFLREGFIAAGHDWSVPVAMPSSAVEDRLGLAITATFHSTPKAQEQRVIAQERLAQGKTVGLSIGYEIAPGGATFEADGRHLRKASRLFEVSLVPVPMNRQALVTSVKSAGRDITYALAREATVAADTRAYAKAALGIAEWMAWVAPGTHAIAWFREAGDKGTVPDGMFLSSKRLSGAVLSDDPKTLRLNADATPREVLRSVGHELWHALQFAKHGADASDDSWEPEAVRFGALLDAQVRGLLARGAVIVQ